MKKKILITGFEPFLNNKKNPTQELAQMLDQFESKKIQIDATVLPVSFKESFAKFKKNIQSKKYDAVILMGLASSSERIRLEQVALNWIDSNESPDNEGSVYKTRNIEKSGPLALQSSVICRVLLSKLKNPKEMDVSFSAGTYVCNYLYYRALNTFGSQTKIIFVHVPPQTPKSLFKTEKIIIDIAENI